MTIDTLDFSNARNMTGKIIPNDLSQCRLVAIGPQTYQVRDSEEAMLFMASISEDNVVEIY